MLNSTALARTAFVFIAPLLLFSSTGCGDDASSPDDGSGGAEIDTCEQTCRDLYACGSADDGALCPAFVPDQTSEAAFLDGNDDDGCIAGCRRDPSLVDIVNPTDCAATITQLSGNDEFDAVCRGM